MAAIKKMTICFMDISGGTLLECRLTSLPLKEAVIINKSIEFFNDPEPCMIHRSAVMNRIFFEMSEYLNMHILEGRRELSWNEIPGIFREYIMIGDDVYFIRLKT
jgi:hypothetical protein